MTNNLFTKVENINQFINLLIAGNTDFFIWLGGIRSSKNIHYREDDEMFEVYNEIDDTGQELTKEGLYSDSNIGKAIDEGKFYVINY